MTTISFEEIGYKVGYGLPDPIMDHILRTESWRDITQNYQPVIDKTLQQLKTNFRVRIIATDKSRSFHYWDPMLSNLHTCTITLNPQQMPQKHFTSFILPRYITHYHTCTRLNHPYYIASGTPPHYTPTHLRYHRVGPEKAIIHCAGHQYKTAKGAKADTERVLIETLVIIHNFTVDRVMMTMGYDDLMAHYYFDRIFNSSLPQSERENPLLLCLLLLDFAYIATTIHFKEHMQQQLRQQIIDWCQPIASPHFKPTERFENLQLYLSELPPNAFLQINQANQRIQYLMTQAGIALNSLTANYYL